MSTENATTDSFRLSGNLYEDCAALLENPWISDLHITAGDPLRLRLSGTLINPKPSAFLNSADVSEFLGRLRDDMRDPIRAIRAAEAEKTDGDKRNGFDFSAPIGNFRCRGNLSMANGGRLSVVLRKLSEKVPELSGMGLPSIVEHIINRPTGLILVTGPTGSGKSTTLASMLNLLNQRYEKHILTIEDPCEYILPRAKCKITRKEIGTDAPSFLSALRAAMRQDPDIIMVGEIRDLGTMRAALSAAETGHLVFATLHTNSAAKTVDRVASFFPAEEKEWAYSVFASVINCVVSQTLVKKLNQDGRVLACELMVGTPAIRSLIKEGKVNLLMNAMEQGVKDGQQTLNRHLTELVSKRNIGKDDALHASPDPDRLLEALKRIGV